MLFPIVFQVSPVPSFSLNKNTSAAKEKPVCEEREAPDLTLQGTSSVPIMYFIMNINKKKSIDIIFPSFAFEKKDVMNILQTIKLNENNQCHTRSKVQSDFLNILPFSIAETINEIIVYVIKYHEIHDE